MSKQSLAEQSAIVIGGGPAGLMAAEVMASAGLQVDVYDAMPSVGRKFLLAGKGGMNLTHAEDGERFLSCYGKRMAQLAPLLQAFGPQALRAWVHGLGVDTFVGSSGRVFPIDMKAAPLLRAWLHRLRTAGVRFHMRHRWIGWGNDCVGGEACELATARRVVRFTTPDGERMITADVIVLALGGGSWARLGSDGAWVPMLQQCDVTVVPLRPANCGFDVAWSDHFRQRFAGAALKTVTLAWADTEGHASPRRGEFIVTEHGVEGSLIYALSASLRDEIFAHGSVIIKLDLLPDWPLQRVMDEASRPRGARSWASHLQSRLGLKGVKVGLLHECLSHDERADPTRLASAIKALPLRLIATRPLDEAISSAGGVAFEALDQGLMIASLPGVFCAGEMLDWEAPTGGYLLTACLASGWVAGQGAVNWLGFDQ